MTCDRDCFNCRFNDCIQDEMDYRDRVELAAIQRELLTEKTPAQKKKAEYRKANREKIAAYNKAYYAANRERALAWQKAYYEAHRAEIAARRKAYYDMASKENLAAQKRAYRARKRAEEATG